MAQAKAARGDRYKKESLLEKHERPAAAQKLIDWYKQAERPLPWRTRPTPYRVWVSEIMLQQTRIEAALPYFERFMAAFPTVAALAEAPEERVLKLWEGLGDYSRAKNLQKCARILVADYGGELPRTAVELKKLPGIGPYTAGAIASIAYGEKAAAVDGNVLRVVARLTCDDRDVLQAAVKKEMTALVEDWMPAAETGAFTQAVMELGERVCLPNGVPLCESCPLAEFCRARALGREQALPVRTPPKERRVEAREVFVFVCGGRLALEKRPDTGLLAGLWQLPNALAGEKGPADWGLSVKSVEKLPAARHIFSHIQWDMTSALVETEETGGGFVWVTPEEAAAHYALPSAFKPVWKAALKALETGEPAGKKRKNRAEKGLDTWK